MSSDPAAPGAAAVFLYREEAVNDREGKYYLYVRLKILTEKGRSLADVELPAFDPSRDKIHDLAGRTIHSDGTIVPFMGAPYDKLIVKTKAVTFKAKIFSLPDVQVGSILEYRYTVNTWSAPSRWLVQQPYFIHKAHYTFRPLEVALKDSDGGMAMRVTDRSSALFVKAYLNWNQLDNIIVIVALDGKEVFFDPGQRYCPFGKLSWKNSMSSGVRETDSGTVIAKTPPPVYADTKVLRSATLNLDAQGGITGSIRITLTGSEALRWRQLALSTDESECKKQFEDELQERLPQGLQPRINHFIGLTDYTSALIAVVDISGSVGTTTGKRMFLPADIFAANTKLLFAEDKRQNLVDFGYPSDVTDSIDLNLPPGLSVESIPSDAEISLDKDALYMAKYKKEEHSYHQGRRLIQGNVYYPVEKYADLRNFYQKLNAQDRDQVVLVTRPSASMNGK